MFISFRKLSSLFFLLLFFSDVVQAQPVIQIKGYNQLYLLDLATGSESLVYTSPYPEIRSVKLSFDGSLFAFVEVDIDSKAAHPQVNHLKVIHVGGSIVYAGHPDVREYTWDPQSNRLAYVTGSFREGTRSFDPTGFYLKDFHSDKEVRIPTGNFKPYAIHWVNNSTEDAIYIEPFAREKTQPFLRYDLSRKTFEPISFRSIDISPDGKYYSVYDVSCRCVKISDRSTQEERSRISLSDTDMPIGWAFNASHLYAVKKTSYAGRPRQITIERNPGTVTLSDSVKEVAIIVVDGAKGQQVQTIPGELPSQPPYAFLFTKPDIVISISPGDARVLRHSPGKNIPITITTIPEKYRE